MNKQYKKEKFKSREEAMKWETISCIGTIKLSKEITIVDGKVVEDE